MKNFIVVVAILIIGGCANPDPRKNTPQRIFEDLPVAPGTSGLRILQEFNNKIWITDDHHSPIQNELNDGVNTAIAEIEQQGQEQLVKFWSLSVPNFTVDPLLEYTIMQGRQWISMDTASSAEGISLLLYEGSYQDSSFHRWILKRKNHWKGVEEIQKAPTYYLVAYLLDEEGTTIFTEGFGYAQGKYLWGNSWQLLAPAVQQQLILPPGGDIQLMGYDASANAVVKEMRFASTPIGGLTERGILNLQNGQFAKFPGELDGGTYSLPTSTGADLWIWWLEEKEGRIYWQRTHDYYTVYFISLATLSVINTLPLAQEVLVRGGNEKDGFLGELPITSERVFYQFRTAKLIQIQPQPGWKFLRQVMSGTYILWIRDDEKAIGLTRLE